MLRKGSNDPFHLKEENLRLKTEISKLRQTIRSLNLAQVNCSIQSVSTDPFDANRTGKVEVLDTETDGGAETNRTEASLTSSTHDLRQGETIDSYQERLY